MTLNKFHISAIVSWFVLLAVLLGGRFALGWDIGTGQIVTLLVVACLAAIVLITVFRGASTSIGQLLYETEHTSSKPDRQENSDVR